MRKILALFLLVLPLNVFASVDASVVARAEKYLNAVTGITGDFVQMNNGKQEQGTFIPTICAIRVCSIFELARASNLILPIEGLSAI